jgi:hypothetical protein
MSVCTLSAQCIIISFIHNSSITCIFFVILFFSVIPLRYSLDTWQTSWGKKKLFKNRGFLHHVTPSTMGIITGIAIGLALPCMALIRVMLAAYCPHSYIITPTFQAREWGWLLSCRQLILPGAPFWPWASTRLISWVSTCLAEWGGRPRPSH